jgi:predicted RNase H-like HicB family nuclease
VTSYIGIVHKDEESDFSLWFPDFPGCVTAGRDLGELKRMAEEALAFHIEGMLEDGEKIPDPSTLEAVMLDEYARDGVPILVPLRSEVLAQ